MRSLSYLFNRYLLPIKKEERKRVVALCIYKALASFIYVIVKSLKEVLVIKYEVEGTGLASVTSCIKGTLSLPISLAFVALYSFLIHRLPPKKVFYGVISFFLGFFILYATFLLPNAKALKLPESIIHYLPFFMQQQHWSMMFQYWMHTLFYIVAFLWAQVMIVLLFFSICNEIFSFEMAKRVYHILLTAGYAGGLMATRINAWLIPADHQQDPLLLSKTMGNMLTLAIAAAFCMLLFYYWIDRNLLSDSSNRQLQQINRHPTRIGFFASIKQVITNPMLIAVLLLLLGANITNSLIEVVYKQNIAEAKTSGIAFLAFNSQLIEWSILISILTGIFVSGNTLQRLGWRACAYVTPLVVLLSGCFFFLVNLYPAYFQFLAGYFQLTYLQFLLLIGTLQHLLWKVTQYMFFDLTKEMSYINMDLDTRRKGKAAVDLLGNSLGHFVGNWILLLVLFISNTENVLDTVYPLLFFCCLACLPWFYGIHYLDRRLKKGGPLKGGAALVEK